jgi:hypothetical protein
MYRCDADAEDGYLHGGGEKLTKARATIDVAPAYPLRLLGAAARESHVHPTC